MHASGVTDSFVLIVVLMLAARNTWAFGKATFADGASCSLSARGSHVAQMAQAEEYKVDPHSIQVRKLDRDLVIPKMCAAHQI